MAVVVLTGDVHHMSMQTSDQRFLHGTEPEAAVRYLDVANAYGVKATLFVSGRSAVEEPAVFADITSRYVVEVGGHGYYARHPRWLYRGAFKRVCRRENGPRAYQAWEIRRTRSVLEQVCGSSVQSWRDHGYCRDRNTYALLDGLGFKAVSDAVDPELHMPVQVGGTLWSLPVNTPPDHDHLVHGAIREVAAAPRALRRSKFPPLRWRAQDWLRVVLEHVEAVARAGGVATILAHPGCMSIVDEFRTFHQLCRELSGMDSIFVTDAVNRIAAQSGLPTSSLSSN